MARCKIDDMHHLQSSETQWSKANLEACQAVVDCEVGDFKASYFFVVGYLETSRLQIQIQREKQV